MFSPEENSNTTADFPPEEQTENVLTTDVVAVEMALLVAFTGCLVWYYSAKDVPWFIRGCVFLSWLLGFMGTLLVPADIVLTLLSGEHSLWVTRVWYIVYWTTFFLAWAVIPILYQSWHSGELTWGDRLKAAVRMNVRQYLIMALIAVLFVVYLIVSGKKSVEGAGGFLMALANTYGLVFIILLLGHGLVQVPSQLWETSFNERELRRLYFIATQVDTDMHDSLFELEEVERSLDCLERAAETKQRWNVEDRRHLKQMLAKIRDVEASFHDEIDDGSFQSSRFTGKHGSRRWDDGRTPEDAFRDLGLVAVTPRVAARLHSDLRAAQVKVVASRRRWTALLREVETLRCVLKNEIPWGDAVFEITPGETTPEYCRAVLWRARSRCGWIWRAYLRWICCRSLAAVCAVLSALILWSEVVAASRWNLSPFGIFLRCMYPHEAGVAHALSLQATVLVPFLYMSLCCYRSLFSLGVFGAFALQGGHHSLPGPLLLNAQYLVRLQFPLGYNFLRILRYYGTQSSRVPALKLPAFQMLMSDMEPVPLLGTQFNVYAPMLLLVLCAFTFCKGYARIVRLVGLEHEDLVSVGDPEGAARIDEGKALVERGTRQAHVAARRRQGEDAGSPGPAGARDRESAYTAAYTAPSLLYSKIEDH